MMTTPQDPRALAIIREARHQFVTVGYAATRIEPIAREASVSTATLYTFFESKSALFEAVIREANHDFNQRMTAIRPEGPATREKLTDYIVRYADFLTDPFVRKMIRLAISERPRFGALAAEFFDTGRGDIAKVLIDIFEQLNAAGEIKMEKSSWVASQLLGMIEYPILMLPIALGRDPTKARPSSEIAIDAIETIWARYGTK